MADNYEEIKDETSSDNHKQGRSLGVIYDFIDSWGIGKSISKALPREIPLLIIMTPFKALSIWTEIIREKNRELRTMWAWTIANCILIMLLSLKFKNPGDALIVTISLFITMLVITNHYGLDVVDKIKAIITENEEVDVVELLLSKFLSNEESYDEPDDDLFEDPDESEYDDDVIEVKDETDTREINKRTPSHAHSTSNDKLNNENRYQKPVKSVDSKSDKKVVKKELKIEIEPVIKESLAMNLIPRALDSEDEYVNDLEYNFQDDDYMEIDDIGNMYEKTSTGETEHEEVQRDFSIAGIPISDLQKSSELPKIPSFPNIPNIPIPGTIKDEDR